MVTDPSYLLNVASLNYAISHSDFTALYNWMTVHKVLKDVETSGAALA
jgi:hypothetical protein